MFGEIAYKVVGDLATKNGWKEGSAEKNALHALVGGIMSELTNSGFLAGASGAMVNEMVQDKLSDMFKDDPAMHQWASALIGGVVSQVAANNAQTGASTAVSGTKNNRLTHEQYLEYVQKIKAAADRGDVGAIFELTKEYGDKDLEQEKELVDRLNNDHEFKEGLINALKENPGLEEYDGTVINGYTITGAADGSNYLAEGVGELADGSKVLVHSEHSKYNSTTKTTDFINDFFDSNESELVNFNKGIVKSYGIAAVDKVIKKLPNNLEVGKESYNIEIGGKTLLSKVSLGGSITALGGSYEIYVDSKKYSGKDLIKAGLIDVTATALALSVGTSLEKLSSSKYGYIILLADGGAAYLISKAATNIKGKMLDNKQ